MSGQYLKYSNWISVKYKETRRALGERRPLPMHALTHSVMNMHVNSIVSHICGAKGRVADAPVKANREQSSTFQNRFLPS